MREKEKDGEEGRRRSVQNEQSVASVPNAVEAEKLSERR